MELSIFLNPNIIYEIKLGDSAFSFEQDLNIEMLDSNSKLGFENKRGLTSFDFSYQAGFKYYYNQRKRISEGKSGNNLSGFYVYAKGEYRYQVYEDILSITPHLQAFKRSKESIGVLSGLGYQKEILDYMFIDFNIGTSYDLYQNLFQSNNDTKFGIHGNIKLGVILNRELWKRTTKNLF